MHTFQWEHMIQVLFQGDQPEVQYDESPKLDTHAQDPPDLFSEETRHFVSHILEAVHFNDQGLDHHGNHEVNEHQLTI